MRVERRLINRGGAEKVGMRHGRARHERKKKRGVSETPFFGFFCARHCCVVPVPRTPRGGRAATPHARARLVWGTP